MTDKSYSGISDAEIAPGQPVTTSLVTRLRDDALAVTQNDPVAILFGGLAGNWVSRIQRLTTPLAPAYGSFIVPTGVNRLLVVVVGAGGCGCTAQTTNLGNGGITFFGNGATPPRAEGGFAYNVSAVANLGVAEVFDCLLAFRGAPGGYQAGGYGSGTIFGPGAPSDTSATLVNNGGYGAGGGARSAAPTSRGGGAGGVGIALMAVAPGDAIAYQIGISFDPTALVGGGNAGADGCIILGY